MMLPIAHVSPKALELFSLLKCAMVDLGDEADNAICNWVSYIGANYRNAHDLCLEYGNMDIAYVDETAFLEPLTVAMTNLTHLRNLSLKFCGLSQSILDSMDTNNIQLKNVKLGIVNGGVNDVDNVGEVFRYLDTVKTNGTVDSLEIYFSGCQDPPSASIGLINFGNNLKLLTRLTIRTPGYSQLLGVIFVAVLQNMDTLEDLVLETLRISDQEWDREMDALVVNKLDTVNRCQMKSLSLHFVTLGAKGLMKKSNFLFQFILDSCPLLEEFKLNGTINARGAFNLDFREHAEWKYIKINLYGCRYYTFHHLFGKQWKNLGGESVVDEDFSKRYEEKLPFYVNLAWMNDNAVKLELTDCKL